jgi:hypothetical protein
MIDALVGRGDSCWFFLMIDPKGKEDISYLMKMLREEVPVTDMYSDPVSLQSENTTPQNPCCSL